MHSADVAKKGTMLDLACAFVVPKISQCSIGAKCDNLVKCLQNGRYLAACASLPQSPVETGTDRPQAADVKCQMAVGVILPILLVKFLMLSVQACSC